MMRSRHRSSSSDIPLFNQHLPRTSRETHFPTLLRSPLPPRLRSRVASSRPQLARVMTSQTSHSRKEPPPPSHSRTSMSLSTVLPPRLLSPLVSPRLREARPLLRLPPSLLARPRRPSARNRLTRLLRRSSSTLPLRVPRRTLLRRVPHLPRNPPPVARSRPPPCLHQAARSLPRPLTR